MTTASPTRRRVAILLTGGTIGSGGHDDLDRLDYVDLAKVLTDEEALPLYRLPDDVDVELARFARIRSNDADEAFWRRLRARIVELAADPGIAGIVVAHGTATLEETAFFLHLTVPVDVPVVLTGAQRPPTAMGSDAQWNLLGAIRVAASTEARGLGVLVAMDDRILTARDVLKSSNHGLDAFRARDHGALGDVDAYGDVWLYRTPTRRHTTGTRFAAEVDDYPTPLPHVEIVPVWAGMSPSIVDRAVEAGAQGLVIAAMPPGMTPSAVEDAVDRAIAAGVVVVQGSRAITGRVAHRRAWDERGLVGSDTLSLPAARILLSLALASGMDRDGVQTAFAEH
ncbi:asparaginase [Agrococcus jejuensis]|uniref:asparaginase n=1 Tax=Agrococcus jejuensis TaxID=399736 RepID=UPI00119DC968|nr:asparaginase [Agrococcus jejuensis]